MTDDEFDAMLVRREARIHRAFRELTIKIALLTVAYFAGVAVVIILWSRG